MQRACCARLPVLCRKIGHCRNRNAADHALQSAVKGIVVVSRSSSGRSGPGKNTTIRLYSRTQIDTNTGKGMLSQEASFRNGKNTKHGQINTISYRVLLHVGPEFGPPGAIVVKNGDRNEFFLRFVTLDVSDGRIHFDCNSWVYPLKKTNVDRLFFANTSYLPSKTPEALEELRQEELVNLRGNGRGERKEWERIYDYDCYNDLGEPDKGPEHVRPVLGGSTAYPYPRRGRTGRPLSNKDGKTEIRHRIINLDFYVPPDERFSSEKLSEFIFNAIQAIVHFVIPEVKSLCEGDPGNFESFQQMRKDLYAGNRERVIEEFVLEKLKGLLPPEIFREVVHATKEHPVKFPVPQVIATDEFAWKSDEEFAREMLAGLNPVVIKCLETFPPVGRGGKQSSISVSHILKENLYGSTVQKAVKERRIFILDHHDYLMPYLRRINEQGWCTYASRTLLLLQNDETLKPLVIELSLPGDEEGEEISRVFLPASQGTEGALWQLAKAHVTVNDSGYHQLISHWLHTHAVVEPFVIATRRQLSAMHPVHRLLEPHFKDTMHVNSLARCVLLNAGGILEKTMFPGKYAMELSSTIYKDWRFKEQGLPADLLKRGFAVKDPGEPSGVRLLFEDYPYAADGLDIWTAIKAWVSGFCNRFYAADNDVASDPELQAWWSEVRHVGHGDRSADELCWYAMDSVADLVEALTTLIWTASALHASVNFGQYAYAGFPANRPTRCRRFIPEEATPEFAEFLRNPDEFCMRMLPDRFTATLGLALIEVLSRHTGDEVYIGRRASEEWTDDAEVARLFGEFGESLERAEKRIEERNADPWLRYRRGPAKVPYTLMYPDRGNVGGEKGITGRGIPNSVSI